MIVSELLNSADFIQATVMVLGYDEYNSDALLYQSNGYPNGAYPLPSGIAQLPIDYWSLALESGDAVLRIYVDGLASDYLY